MNTGVYGTSFLSAWASSPRAQNARGEGEVGGDRTGTGNRYVHSHVKPPGLVLTAGEIQTRNAEMMRKIKEKYICFQIGEQDRETDTEI